jgi:hypothetical protein
MKFKSTFLIASFFIFFISHSAFSCPVYKIGAVQIINESGELINSAKMWRIIDKDSFILQKSDRFVRDASKKDTTYYSFYTSGMFSKLPSENKSYYRIQAEGYADVVIENFNFNNTNKKDRDWTYVPFIKITLYPSKYILKDDQLIKFTEYHLKTIQSVNDTSIIDLSHYTQFLKEENSVESIQRKANSGMHTYPNPATTHLQVDLKDSMIQPFKAVICNMNGKELKSVLLTETSSKILLDFEQKGVFLITVYNHEGELKYCHKFVRVN